MRILAIGSGLSGTIFAKTCRELNPDAEIEIYGDEEFLYYPRPNLIEYLAGNLAFERLFPFSETWFEERNIRMVRGRKVRKIDPHSHQIFFGEKGSARYDVLCLCNGSFAFTPPIPGSELQGVQTLRTLADAQQLLEQIRTEGKAVVIGGGLLGLEIARALKNRGAEVEVVEFFPRLLPRQLDDEGAALLKSQIAKMGIQVTLGATTEKILGEGKVEGISLKNGRKIRSPLVVIAAGVRPDVALAKNAGVKTDKGIIVDDRLQTSIPGIYAAGDNTQHQDKLYGIIPAAFTQAQAAAFNATGRERLYSGSVPSNTLKVIGLSVTSVGEVNPESGDFQEFRKSDPDRGIYKKLVLRGGSLTGAIWMGTKQGAREIALWVTQKKQVEKWRDQILDEDFPFSEQ